MTASGESTKALDGMTILDLTQIMAGPYCTMTLADLGADVIKIENPGSGDQTRTSWGRPGAGRDSRAFMALNRNKRSMTLNLKDPEDLRVFYRLVRKADVVVENFRPGVTARLGIDYETLVEHNPALIYASITGFGLDGPYADRPGYDLIAQAMSGAMSITGESGGRPVKCGLPVGDLGAGLFSAIGILGAWTHRERTGEGQFLETSLFESIVAMSVWESVEYYTTGEVPQALGSANRMSAPYQALATRDGYVTVGANNDRLWRRLCEAIGDVALAEDARFVTNMDRMDNLPELVVELEQRMATRGTDEWVEVLLRAGVPAGPIHNYQQVFDEDPHVQARGLIASFNHPVEGDVPVVASPIRLAATPPEIYRHAPLLGEHTEELLTTAQQEAAS